MTKEKIGLVVSEYNADITLLMRDIASEHAVFLGAEISRAIMVPGAFDSPIAAKKLADDKDIDAIVVLGAVIEGDTDHDTIVAQNAARKLMDISVASGKPVGLGISGPKMSRADGIKRLEGYAKRAVETAIKMTRRLKQ